MKNSNEIKMTVVLNEKTGQYDKIPMIPIDEIQGLPQVKVECDVFSKIENFYKG